MVPGEIRRKVWESKEEMLEELCERWTAEKALFALSWSSAGLRPLLMYHARTRIIEEIRNGRPIFKSAQNMSKGPA